MISSHEQEIYIRPNRNGRRQNKHIHSEGKSHNYSFIYGTLFVCLYCWKSRKKNCGDASRQQHEISASMEQITRATTLRFLSRQAKLIDIVENGAEKENAASFPSHHQLSSRTNAYANDCERPQMKQETVFIFSFLNKISIFMGEGDLLTKNHYSHFYSFHRYTSQADEIHSRFEDMIDAHDEQRKKFCFRVASDKGAIKILDK